MNRVANNPVTISNKFDGGNITVIDSSNPNDIQLAIKPDNASDFFQWFYFRLDGGAGQRYRFRLVNAGEASFAEGWNNYQVCTSSERPPSIATANCILK
jgi:murein tripeptide amidase MpaA